MADSTPTFNIFGDPTKDDIKVGYISTDRGFVSGVGICEANDYAKLNPGTVFIFKNREEIKYININDVNKLTVNDLDLSETCEGIEIDKESSCKPTVETFGGAGLGVLANPIVGKDGSIISVDVVEGGFGYQSEPSAVIKDPCSIGAGAELRVEMVENAAAVELEYDDEEDFEEYEICNDDNNVGFGRRYDPNGKDIGEWNPALYLDDGTLSFDEELKKYSDFLLTAPNPWWTTRTEPPLKTTSEGKISRAKYDVYHWAWGAKPGENDPIDNLYIKLFGRRGEPSGLDYWRDRIASGKNLSQIEDEMKTMPEWKEVCEGECKPVMPDVTYGFGTYWEYDKNNFMNKYAISPVPMSNVKGSDFGGQEHYFEWDVDFPHSGDYIFKFQCDNQGSLYIDGEKKGEYKIGKGGAEGNVLSPPETAKVGITTGLHTVRIDVSNGAMMEKVAEQNEKLQALSTSDEVKFDVQVATLYGASATIEGLDISFAKTYGEEKRVNESVIKKVEYGRVYDVKITSDTKRTGNLPATNKALIIDGKGSKAENRRRQSSKRLEFDDNGANGFDINATFTIDSGNATFAEDGLSVKGTGEQTITLWWNDARKSGRAINSIKLGSTIWTRTGKSGSETHTLTLGGGVGQLGGANNKAVLRTQGAKVLQMEDIPGEDAGTGGTGNEAHFYQDVIIAVDQGRFFDINGLTAKYTLGDRPAESGVSSTESAGKVTTIFNTADYIDKANRTLWRTNPVVAKDSSFTNRYGITPLDPSLTYTGSESGFHEIKWHNVNFPVSGEYDIGIGVDDNVTLRIGGDVNISKQGFDTRGDGSTYTGTSLYRRFIRAGTYTVIADLEQVSGGKYGASGKNPMSLAIDIATVFTEKEVQSKKSWNQNPFGVALAIEAPDPPVPQEPLPVQEGRCPPNPFWSTRFPAEDQWYPFSDRRRMYRYAMSPVKPYGEENSSGGGQTYSNTWNIEAPYGGFYKLKVAADDSAVIKLDGNEVLRTVGVSTQSESMVGIDSGPHEVTVEVSNVGQETYDSIDQRVFTTQGWAAIGTQVEQALNTNEVDFKFSTSTLYGATASIDGLGISIEKTYGEDNVSETFSKQVEFDRVYDVKIGSNTIRSESSTSTIGGSYALVYTKLKNGALRRINDRRLEYDDRASNIGFDRKANEFAGAFTIDNVVGGTAKFSADGSSVEVQGDEVKVTLTYNWDDNPRRSGRVLETIAIKDTIWRQLNWRPSENRWVVESIGSHTYTVTLAGKTTSTSSKTIGGANNGAVLRTKGDKVLQMEDIPNTDAGGGGVGQYWDDVIVSVSQGRFFDINGMNAKYVLEKETKTVIQGGTGSGTVKDGVVYNGPELLHKNYSGWGSFMNKASVSPNPMRDNATTEVVEYSWSNIDFPETGEYNIKFQNDHSATLFLDGKQIASNKYRGKATETEFDRDKRHSLDMTGMGNYKKVLVEKGKHTLTVKPTVYTEASGGPIGFIDALFKQPVGYKWEENPSGFAIEIRKKMKVVRTDATGKPVTKSWKENPVLVSAHLIPPPCPRVVEGKGSVDKIIPIVPGNGYSPPPTGGGDPRYDVILELTNVIIEDPGINYDPDDEVVITGGPGDPVIPPFKPVPGPFGSIIDIPVPPTAGFTTWPDISISTSTGTGFRGIPVMPPRRTPPLVDPDRLLQVTDLVGLKQTGYYDGKPYYGAIFYKEGVKYAGWYETAGQLVQVYDTLQESIDAMVTTPASAIQRQGSDIRSNDPRLDIPGTPDNLTY